MAIVTTANLVYLNFDAIYSGICSFKRELIYTSPFPSSQLHIHDLDGY